MATIAPGGNGGNAPSDPSPGAPFQTSTSAVSARGNTAASTRPGGMTVGRSLRLWTATEIVPASSSVSSSFVNNPGSTLPTNGGEDTAALPSTVALAW